MKKILFINILAILLGATQLNGQCGSFVVFANSTDETCEDANDGTATATAAAGSLPYFYNWSNGGTTAEITGLGTGSYTVTVTDVNGCVAISIVQVTLSPEGIWLMPSSTPVSCFGGNDGTAYPGVMSGTAPYIFNWDDPNNQSTETAVGLTAGQYHVTVTDVNGCSNSVPVTVNSPSELVNSISNTTNVTCSGDSNGSVSASASGGTGSISYSWSNGGSGNTINGVTAGTYTVTATDANGCTSVTSSTVGVTNPIVSAFTNGTNVVCNGANDGTATVNVSSGVAPYTYLWSNGQTGATATGLAPGTYDVTVTDANGCTWVSTAGSSSVTINQPLAITISDTNTTNVACHGASSGSVSITAFGGTGTLSYAWSNGATGSSISGLAAGTYTGTITDANGCTATTTVTITEPSALSATGSSTGVTTPGGSDGSATVNVNGGTPGYTYSWSNGATTQTISGLTGGTYTVTITDANGCTTTTTVTVSTPQVVPITLTVTNTSANCSSGSDGSATVTASGGVMPYTYLWSNGQTGATATGLAPGTYTVTVTDAQGNSETISTTIGSTGSTIVATPSSSNETCVGSQDGHVSVSTSGGVGQMTFLWSTGATTSTVNGLSVGTYTVTVTDENGCTATATTSVELSPEGVWVDVTPTHVSCFGASNGSASTSVTTGTPPYTYNWSNGQTTPNATGLAAGTYTVTVTDANGCSNTYTTTINGPTTGSAISISTTPTNIDCAGNMNGSVNTTVTGGNAGYTYAWSNGASSSNLSSLGAGTYTLTVTDNSGCTSTEVVTITEPSPLTASGTGTDPSTNGGSDGSIDLTVGGGTAGYTYLWSNGATTQNISGLTAGCYTVTVTDANNCTTVSTTCITEPLSVPNVTTTTTSTSGCVANSTTGSATANASSGTSPYTYLWSNGGTTQTISGVGAGTYTVTVTDANGTTATSSTTVATATNPSVAGTGSMVNCGIDDGTASSNPSGGTPGYTYSWNTGATTQNISGLGAGTYTVTVTDTNGCTATTEVVVAAGNAPPVIVMTNGTDPNTPGGMNGFVTANVSSGTAPYTYLWSNGATTQTITGLATGCYTVTVTDANGCTAESEECITAPVPIVVNTTSTSSNECSGTSTGTATAVVTSGVPAYTYLWSNGGTTETITGLPPGTYTVTVTDSAGSMISSTIVVGSVPLPTVVGTGSSINCGIIDGTASAMAGGGTPGYTYEWSTGATTQNISGLGAGVYTVTATDSNGCTATTSVNVIENSPAVNVTAMGTNPNVPGGMNGFVTANVGGGSAPFIYLWSNGATTQTINGLGAGCYTVTVTDANGCTAESEECLVEPVPITVTVSTTSSIECNGDDDGTATVTPTSGVSPYTYIWSSGDDTATANNLVPGTYTVTVTDANGAMAVETVIVGSVSNPTVSGTGSNINCGIGDGTASAAGAGGTPLVGGGYNYAWSNGAMTQNLSGVGAGLYTVTVTDANGCTGTTEVSVIENSPAASVTTTGTNMSAPGANDGSITANPAGGTPGFTYSWSNGATTQTIDNLSPGCYTVTITDAVGCTAESTTCIPEIPILVVTVTTTSSVECNGNNDGTATVTPTTGTPDYTYVWSTGDSTQTVNNLPPGTYTVTVTDATGAMAVETIIVGSVSNPTVSGTGSSINCGIADGTASSTGAGGTPLSGGGYNYAWSNGAMTQNLSGVGAGLYTVTVTDANGCTGTTEVSVTENSPAVSVMTTGTNMSAPGANDGSITATPSGGTPGFTYSWSNGATTQTIDNLSPGCYTVTITDAVGCTEESTTCIPEIPILVVTVTTTSSVECNGNNDGTATVTPTTGTPDYTYVWSTGDSTQTVNNLPPGTYTVTVTDATGAMAVETITIGSVANPSVSGTGSDINCGIGDGTANSTGSGGTPFSGGVYEYLWSTGDMTQDLSGLAAGTYTVTVTDANGCTATTEVSVTENSPAASVTTTETNMSAPGANDGTITANPAGGTPGFTYVWSNGAMTQTIDNLSPGCYTVTITDMVGCTAESTSCIPEIPVIIVSLTTTASVECNGSNDGTATVTPTSGTPPYTYLWDDSQGQMDSIATDLTPGVYTVTVTDANGGMAIETVTVGELGLPSATATSTDISCNGMGDGTLDVLATNGTGPYTYLWDTPNSDTTSFVDGQSVGMYSVTVTDANGCTTVANIPIDEADPIDALQDVDQIDCNGGAAGSITMMPSGGTEPYSYMWSTSSTDTLATIDGLTAGVYTVTITDSLGCTAEQEIPINEPAPIDLQIQEDTTISCDGSAIIDAMVLTTVDSILWTDANGNVIGMGNDYSVLGAPQGSSLIYATAYANNGCTGTDSTILFVPEPIELMLSPQDTMVECEQTMLELSASNPNVVSYTWYDDPALSNEIGTGANLPAFLSGAPQYYYVQAEDSYGCPVVDSVFAGHTEIISLLEQNLQACVGDSLVLDSDAASNVAGAIINYTWLDANGGILGMDSTLTLNPASDGMYFIEMTDQFGCSLMDSTNVSLFDLAPLLDATADEDTILIGMESQLLVLPDEDGFTYQWSDENTIVEGQSTDNNPVVAPTEDTNYGVLVTHPNGCSALTNVLVTVIDPTCDDPFIFFPNAFSPNDDGVNDVLYLRGFSVDESYFMIFNRWGQKVFESNNQSVGWDGTFNGKKVCNDVYGYYLRVTCINGEEYIKKGNVTVFN